MGEKIYFCKKCEYWKFIRYIQQFAERFHAQSESRFFSTIKGRTDSSALLITCEKSLGNGISVPVSSSLERDSPAKMGGHSMGVFRTINWGPYPITIQAIIQDRYSIQKIALITDS